MRHNLLVVFLLFFIVNSYSQDKRKRVKFSGFVKTDIYWDSRQTVSARDGQFFLYPANKNFDKNKNDLNAISSFNFLSIQSRLKLKAIGPDALGAKTQAILEGAFLGNIESNINTFRLRHAFVKLDWGKANLLIGQYWHPMFNTLCFPKTISFNTGAPFQPFSRNPQIRYTKQFGNFNFSIAVLSQLDFKDSGPDRFSETVSKKTSSEFLRNGGIPEFDFNVIYKYKEGETKLTAGVFMNAKSLHLDVGTTYSDNLDLLKVKGFSYMGFIKVETPKIITKFNFTSGELTESMTMIGGYVLNFNILNNKQVIEYDAYLVNSYWVDIHTQGEKWQFGIFGGHCKKEDLYDVNLSDQKDFSRGSDIKRISRISPRVIYNSGNLRLAAEYDITSAAYYISTTNRGTDDVINHRGLLGVYYFF